LADDPVDQVQVAGLARKDEPIQRFLHAAVLGSLRGAGGRLAPRQPAGQKAARDADSLLDDRFGGGLKLAGVQADPQGAGVLDGVGDAALAEQGADLLVVQLEDRWIGPRLATAAQLDLGRLGVVPERVKGLQPRWVVPPARRQYLFGRVQ